MRQGRYYLGRILKLGRLTEDMVVEAILDSPIVQTRKFAWAVTDVLDKRKATRPFVYGKLSKFTQEGLVKVVDTESKLQINESMDNLLVASSPFVYLPDYSGIAYLHVWNQIQEDVFPRRMKKIIEAAFNYFFVECQIESVADYTSFVSKISGLKRFIQISAKVHPPNPLFGRLWKSLDRYIQDRNVEEYSVKETSAEETGISTGILSLMQNLIENSKFSPDVPPTLTDAALLMAADGYGHGKIVGISKKEKIIIKTSETKKSFPFEKGPDPQALAEKAWQEFFKVNKERDMEHP